MSQTLYPPFMLERVAAGFPSPADDYVDHPIDLNERLIPNPPATFLIRVAGDSMCDAGIHHGDVLIVDRSLTARDGKIIVARYEGCFTVKRFLREPHKIVLMPENPLYPPIEIGEEQADDLDIWGVVTGVIREYHP